MISPCSNCKLENSCEFLKKVKENKDKVGIWQLDEIIRSINSYGSVCLLSADKKSDKVVLECSLYKPIKTQHSYSELLNSKNKEPDDVQIFKKLTKCGSGCNGCNS